MNVPMEFLRGVLGLIVYLVADLASRRAARRAGRRPGVGSRQDGVSGTLKNAQAAPKGAG